MNKSKLYFTFYWWKFDPLNQAMCLETTLCTQTFKMSCLCHIYLMIEKVITFFIFLENVNILSFQEINLIKKKKKVN